MQHMEESKEENPHSLFAQMMAKVSSVQATFQSVQVDSVKANITTKVSDVEQLRDELLLDFQAVAKSVDEIRVKVKANLQEENGS